MVCWAADTEHCSEKFLARIHIVLFYDFIFTQSIGGNICNASPISDLNPVLMACGAKLNLASKGTCTCFTDYTTALTCGY